MVKSRYLKFIQLQMLLALIFCLIPAYAIDLNKVEWMDDFLGIRFDRRYNFSVANGGRYRISSKPSVNGWATIYTDNTPKSVSRIRLGEDPDDSKYDAMPFKASHSVSGKTRLIVYSTDLDLTAGFVGRNDPANVAAALYRKQWGWCLQTVKDNKFHVIKTYVYPKPGVPFDLEVKLTSDSTTLLVDGKVIARSKTSIPTSPLAWEFQIWNKEKKRKWMPAKCLIDYLYIAQNRMPTPAVSKTKTRNNR